MSMSQDSVNGILKKSKGCLDLNGRFLAEQLKNCLNAKGRSSVTTISGINKFSSIANLSSQSDMEQILRVDKDMS